VKKISSGIKILTKGEHLKPFRLGPAVLEPDLDLRLRQLQLRRELGPLRDGQILLVLELLLQGRQLLGRERGPGLPVGLVFSKVTTKRAQLWLHRNVWKERACFFFKIDQVVKNSNKRSLEWVCLQKHFHLTKKDLCLTK
jgi:hypothetical protein